MKYITGGGIVRNTLRLMETTEFKKAEAGFFVSRKNVLTDMLRLDKGGAAGACLT